MLAVLRTLHPSRDKRTVFMLWRLWVALILRQTGECYYLLLTTILILLLFVKNLVYYIFRNFGFPKFQNFKMASHPVWHGEQTVWEWPGKSNSYPWVHGAGSSPFQTSIIRVCLEQNYRINWNQSITWFLVHHQNIHLILCAPHYSSSIHSLAITGGN